MLFSFQLEDGDVICYQKSPPLEIADQYRYPDVPSFLDYVHNRQVYGVDTICISKLSYASMLYIEAPFCLLCYACTNSLQSFEGSQSIVL